MDDIPVPIPANPTRLLDQVRQTIRARHLAYRTEKTYIKWIREFIRFHHYRHPSEMSGPEIDQWLGYLAANRLVAINTQKTALNAIVFLYRHVLHKDLGELNYRRARRPRRLPDVFTHKEAISVLEQLTGQHRIIASLMYGSGLRVMEAVRLRVKDIDFAQGCLIIREAKGDNPRRTLLPYNLQGSLRAQVDQALALHQLDLEQGFGQVYLPDALNRKYPKAASSPEWQYVFPASQRSLDPRSHLMRRHHIGEQQVRRVVKSAIRELGIRKHASCHTFRHSFATNLLRSGTDIRNIQALLGHKDINTTLIYTPLVGEHERGIVSPLDTPNPN